MEVHMPSQAEKNKALRKMRTMRYFIDAARNIIATQGVGAVNIRSVAAKAGYSSGSIYDYFKNIDQLIAFAAIDSIHDFLGEIASHVTEKTDPLEFYIITWHFFSEHAFHNPALYEKVALIYGTNIISFLNEYYELFPQERREFPALLKEFFFAVDKQERDHSILLQCVEKGYFRKSDIEDISKMINAGFLGCLKYCNTESSGFDSQLFMKMIKTIILGYNPALEPLLGSIVLTVKGNKTRKHKKF
jgi:AcrR family transcriptional regulator